MFLSRNKKNNVYPRKALFYCIKKGFSGVVMRLVRVFVGFTCQMVPFLTLWLLYKNL